MDHDSFDIKQHASATSSRASQPDVALELHHRVANNLQLVASFLSLQERGIADPSAKSALKTAASRVAAAGQVHRALLQDSTDIVNLGALLTSVCAAVAEAAGVTVNVTADHTSAPADAAQALAIAVSELILNAAKHAYGGLGGVVDVKCRKSPGSMVTVTVSDRGPGFMANDEADRSSGVGMKIIRAQIARWGGSLTFHNAFGTHATLTVSIEPNGIGSSR